MSNQVDDMRRLLESVSPLFSDQQIQEDQMDPEEAKAELEALLENLYEISDQVKSIMRAAFPEEFEQGEAYGAFDFGTSSNRYDTTFENILQSLGNNEQDEW